MVMSTYRGGSGSGSRLGYGAEPIAQRIREFVSSKITCGILDGTLVMSGTIKEGIIELLNEQVRNFHAEIVSSQIEVQALYFWEFKG